ncbi:hypothetical protein F0562_023539 [Nyssa sinensis]|uniref:Pentatricopeptide repeat-containing protein n=1 Tax=Nyssa sinensis TaxID=561372 RepID=A0A5J5BGR7_9ASTE|nr:hypothetical protein F0562_023539 [Nyssa sinensis]
MNQPITRRSSHRSISSTTIHSLSASSTGPRNKKDFITSPLPTNPSSNVSLPPAIQRRCPLKASQSLKIRPRPFSLLIGYTVTDYSNAHKVFNEMVLRERRICEANEMGEVIVSGNFPTEDDVLNGLIGSASTISPCSAMLFFKFMVEKERFPTLLTLSNLSRNLLSMEKIDELLEVFQSLTAKEYFSEVKSYKVSFLFKIGKVKEEYGVLLEMMKKGLCPDVSFYNSLMEA